MAITSVLIDPILPVFAIMALGYALGVSGRTTVADAQAINRFAMSVPLPLLIFGLCATAPIEDFSLAPLLFYAGAEAALFGFGFALARFVFQRSVAESVLLAFAGIFANNAFFGLAIAELLYGAENILPVTAVVALDSAVTFGAAMATLGIIGLGKTDPLAIASTLARTPILQGIALGVVVNVSGVSIPAPIQTFIDFNGGAAAPIALFALGVVLSQTPIRPDACVLSFSAIKLIAFPALIWFGAGALAPSEQEAGVWVLAAAAPAGAMAFTMALLHGVPTGAIAQVIIITSALSVFTMAALA